VGRAVQQRAHELGLLGVLLFLIGIGLYLIPLVAGFSMNSQTSRFVGAILKGAQIGAKYLSNVPYKSYVPFIFLLLGSAILLFLTHLLKYKSTVFLVIVITVGIGFFYGSRFIFPMLDSSKSARFLSQEVRQAMKPGDRLAMYGGFAIGPYNFYTGIVPIVDIVSDDEMVNFFRSKERGFCLIQNVEYETLKKKDLGIPLKLVTRRKVGGKDIVLVSNRIPM
jgi:hypothetical protein